MKMEKKFDKKENNKIYKNVCEKMNTKFYQQIK